MASKGFKHARSTQPFESPSDRVKYGSMKSTAKKRPHATIDEEGEEGHHGDGIKGGNVYGPNSEALAAAARYHALASMQDHHAPSARPAKFRSAGDSGNSLTGKEHRSR